MGSYRVLLGKLGAPGLHGMHERFEGSASVGEVVLDTWGHFWVGRAAHDTVLLQFPELSGQGLGVRQGHETSELVEAASACQKVLDQRELPRTAQDGNCHLDRADLHGPRHWQTHDHSLATKLSVLAEITLTREHRSMHDNDNPLTVLWVSAHPERCSLNGSLRRDAIAHLRRNGHTVLESDLYAMNWDPVVRASDGGHVYDDDPSQFLVSNDTRNAYLVGAQPSEIQAEQTKLREASAIVVQFPLWWYGMPAIMKGWFDRVFVSGFAFGVDAHTGRRLRFEQGPFVGKRALVVTTLGDRPQAIGPRGKSGELHELLFGLLHGTFAYTGMSVLPPWALPSADHITDYGKARDDLLQRLDRLFTDEPIAYRPQFTGEYTEEWELAPHVCPGERGVRVHIKGAGMTNVS